MADALGVELRLEVMPFFELLDALEAGTVDMVLSGMTITPERNRRVAFVGPYFTTGKSFLTKTATLLSIKDASEINTPGTTLAALRGSTSQLFVEVAIPKARLVSTSNYDEAVEMVIQGTVDALVADFPICAVSVFRNLHKDKALACLMTPLTYEPIGVAISGSDPHFINWVENFFNTMAGSGELKALEDRWFKSSSWLNELP
jgi:polar amino acid transport system substrate-binding protein